MLALSVDVGCLMMTRTQLQAAADSATLSAGTKLIRGLGHNPELPATVAADARTLAVQFAAMHPNGDVTSTFVDPNRDVSFGWAVFNSVTGAWVRNWGSELPVVGGYNMVGVTTRRDQPGSANNDKRIPLLFANVLGHSYSNMTADATAVIMPATGFRIQPGSTDQANVMPIAFRGRIWDKYIRAQADYDARGGFPSPLESVIDSITAEPLYGHFNVAPNGDITFVQDFTDLWACNCTIHDQDSTVSAGSDGMLELDVFPRDDYSAGNFGTIDIGSSDNSTADLERQILYGPNASDLAYYPNSTFPIPSTTTGDTGISAGIKDDLQAVIGECRAVLLFESVTSVGNTSTFSITRIMGVRLMHVELTGQLEYKHLRVQLCQMQLVGGVGDMTSQIGPGTTVFTPLILIE
jgi:hypothetical protein